MSKLIFTLAAVLVAFLVAGCGGSKLSMSTLANDAGAESCSNSGFFYQDPPGSGPKLTIYDCKFAPNNQLGCVMYANGVARVVTDAVSAGFAGATNGKPACVGG